MALQVISKLGTFLLCIVLGAQHSSAQDHSIQSAIFEDCEEAQKAFSILDQEKRSALLDYLIRVVGLNTQAPAAPEVFAVLPSGKNIEQIPPALWQTTDAKRELRAKRCALELLTMAGPLAFNNLPQLASLYSQQPLSDEIAVGIEEATASIAEQAHKNGQTLSDDVIDKLVPLLKSDRPLVTQNLLHEYLPLALPRILIYLSNLPEAEASRVIDFLKDADPDGGRAMRALIDLIPKLPSDSSSRLALYLPFPSKEATAPLVADFARLSADPTHGIAITSLLAKACVSLEKVLIEPGLAATLVRNPALLSENAINPKEQRCLISSSPVLANYVATLITSNQDSDIRQGLDLLPPAIGGIAVEQRSTIFDRVKELALQAKNSNREKSILAVATFTDRRAEANSFLLQLLKDSLLTKDMRSVASVVDVAFQAAITLNTNKDINRFGSVALETLKRGASSPALIEAASRIDSIESNLVGLVGSAQTETALHALRALKIRKNLSRSSLPAIVEALRHPALSTDAETILIAQGAATVPLLRRALLRSSSSQRLGFLAILEVFGAATKGEQIELTNVLSTGEGCTSVHARPQALQGLLNSEGVDSERKQKLTAKVLSCLCSYEHTASAALLAASGRALLTAPTSVDELLKDTQACGHLEAPLLLEVASSSLPEPLRLHILTKIIQSGSRASRIAALGSLTKGHPLSQKALPSIRILATTTRDDQELTYKAILALARVGDTEFEWPRFVRDIIDSSELQPHHKIALEIVRALPVEIVLSEVTPALDSDNPTRVAGACRVGATLGQLAIPIVSKVWNLRERRSPVIKYAAILALLEINPLTPELHMGLRAILANRYYATAYQSPIQWRQCVAVVDLDKTSFGTLRTIHLERLLLK